MNRYIKNGFVFFLLSIFLYSSASAADGLEGVIKFRRFGGGEGFPQVTVTCIHRDSKGFMWFGTLNGLNKYDGYRFTHYKYTRDSAHSPGQRSINCIHEDREGFLWFGTGGGLDKFDPATETFTHYRCLSGDTSEPVHLSVYTVFHSMVEPGVLWVGTAGGLKRFDRAAGTFMPVPMDRLLPGDVKNKSVQVAMEDGKGILWFTVFPRGLFKYDIRKKESRVYRHSSSVPGGLSHDWVYSIVESRREPGILWLGTLNGVDRFDTGAGTFTHYRGLSSPLVRTLFESPKEPDILWVGTSGGGLNKLNTRTGESLCYRNNPMDFHSLSGNTIWAIYQSPSGVLWVGTPADGLSKSFTGGDKKFFHFYGADGAVEWLSEHNVMDIRESAASPGIFWLGTGDGIARFERETGRFEVSRRDPRDPSGPGGTVANAVFESPGAPGVLWAGYVGGGLDKYDVKTKTFVNYIPNRTGAGDLWLFRISNIYESPSLRGVLWAVTGNGVIHRVDIRGGSITSFRPGSKKAKRFFEFMAIHESPSRPGTLWIATGGRGLVKFRMDDGEYSFLLTGGGKSGVPGGSNYIFSLYESPRAPGVLWVGTDLGLLRFDIKTETFSMPPEVRALSDNTVMNLSEDENGNFWLVTNNALVKLDLRTGLPESYDVKDGLRGNGYTGAICRSRGGEILVGGIDGFNVFSPRGIGENRYPPPVAITGLFVLNRPVGVGQRGPGGNVILEKSIAYTEEIALSYKAKAFAFEFAALNYSMPERNEYAYMLEGFDGDWNYCGLNRTATFTGLAPGTYTFRVKAANEDGVWNETGTSIRVIAAPPWWRSDWAYAFYIVFFTFVVVVLNRVQRARLVRRERYRAGIEEARLRAEAAEAQARALEAEHKRKTHELEEAAKLQLAMLPEKVPDIPGYDVAVYMKAATEVGGDYYDFYIAEDGTLIAAVGDATGHGLKAGTMVSIMKSLFLADVSDSSPGSFFDKVNRTIKRMRLGNLYMALTLVRLKEGKGVVVAAGMPPVYIYRKAKNIVEEITLKAPPMGAFAQFRSRRKNLTLREGDTLLLFSDGLPESFNPGGEMFGYARLKALFSEKGGEAPAAVVDHLVRAGEEWLSGSPQGDDMTFVVLTPRRG